MQSHLDPKPLAIVHFKFHQCNQKSDETIPQFVLELQKYAEHCDFRIYLTKHFKIGWYVDYIVKQYKGAEIPSSIRVATQS